MRELFRKVLNRAAADESNESMIDYKQRTTAEFAADFLARADDLQLARKSYEEAKAVSQKLFEFEVCL